ncbi:MAG TPA: 3-isopropylmalate dehydrogenase [Candidatus Saccharimonadales bacterium]|nr:3-isopropylmalate dehydrogenase [Candidatus Saccharimonadales bacterium]
MKKTIAVLPGDGIGPEIIEQAVNVLKKIAEKYDHEFEFQYGEVGAIAIDKKGNPFPEETKELCLNADTILFGAIGDPKYDNDPSAKIRPEQGLLAMRKTLGLYANFRPIFTLGNTSKSPLKPEIIKDVDFVVIRELIGGIYFGKKGRSDDKTYAYDTNEYSKSEIQRVVEYAFKVAETRLRNNATARQAKLTVVDKANVLETSRLWRETVQEMMPNHPKVTVEFMFVDNAAMQMIKRPSAFDVIVTENMFGDILTDEASVITGSIGMLPSASVGEKSSLFEPIHGSFPKAAGKNTANPIGSILSAAMMLAMSFGLEKESQEIYKAVTTVIDEGYGTADITDDKIIGTKELGEKIIEYL